VLYVQPDCVAAYVELGALYEREGDALRAQKMRASALALLETGPPEALVPPYEALNAQDIVSHLKKLVEG